SFYTNMLGFVKKLDIPLGGGARWLTLVSPGDPDGVQLLLEPDALAAAKTFKRALVDEGIPATTFQSSDIQADYERMSKAGVRFVKPPTPAGPVTIAVFDDTCGNLIQLHQNA
ncbi:MAG TPA: VOC family protein, partial [Gemmatimonadaceae bacterium]